MAKIPPGIFILCYRLMVFFYAKSGENVEFRGRGQKMFLSSSSLIYSYYLGDPISILVDMGA